MKLWVHVSRDWRTVNLEELDAERVAKAELIVAIPVKANDEGVCNGVKVLKNRTGEVGVVTSMPWTEVVGRIWTGLEVPWLQLPSPEASVQNEVARSLREMRRLLSCAWPRKGEEVSRVDFENLRKACVECHEALVALSQYIIAK